MKTLLAQIKIDNNNIALPTHVTRPETMEAYRNIIETKGFQLKKFSVAHVISDLQKVQAYFERLNL